MALRAHSCMRALLCWNTNIATPATARFHWLCPEPDKETRCCVWYIETVKSHIAASWHCARSFNALHDSACAGGEKRPRKALLEDFSPAPCFTCSMLRDTTLCDQIEAQLLLSRTYAHALFSSINVATHRQLPLNMFGCLSKKSQNMQNCRPQTLEQGIIHVYLHETRL